MSPHAHAGLHRATVIANRRFGAFAQLTVEVRGWAGAQPGQFTMLLMEGSSRFTARPFSVSDEERNADGTRLRFLIAPIGPGSRELSALQPGQRLTVLGPLGRGFPLDDMLAPAPVRGSGAGSCPAAAVGKAKRRLVLVAGGVGLAPFPLLIRLMADRLSSPASVDDLRPPLLICGFRNAGQAGAVDVLRESAEDLRRAGMGSGLLVTTDDGSVGACGVASHALAQELEPGDRVAVCGPPAMCSSVWEVCREVPDVLAWFSLESRMACGVGSCHGCVIPLPDGRLAKVCRKGPVFDGAEVFGTMADEGCAANERAGKLAEGEK